MSRQEEQVERLHDRELPSLSLARKMLKARKGTAGETDAPPLPKTRISTPLPGQLSIFDEPERIRSNGAGRP